MNIFKIMKKEKIKLIGEKIDEYVNYLECEIAKYKTSAESKRKIGDSYEAILDNIRVNVITIFSQLFKKALNEIDKKSGYLVGIYTEKNEEKHVQLRNIFMGLLRKIRSQWEISLDEAKKYHDDDVVIKENVKIDTANFLSNKFEEIFEVTE